MNAIRDLFKDYRFAFSFGVMGVFVILAILSAFSPYDPTLQLQVPADLFPSWTHFFGTNSQGQDIFWRASFAIRNSLIIAVIAAVFSRLIAILVGFIAGYKGGALDRILSSITDGFLVIPIFLVLVMLAMLLRDSMNLASLGLLLGIFGWAWDARIFRGEILRLREKTFTYTAVLSGTSTLKLVLKEYLPFVMPLILSTVISNMWWSIGMEITLAILGLTNLDIPTLGTMIHWALDYQAMLLGHWWWILTPVSLAVALLLALYLLSVSISEYLDPRTRVQRVGRK